MEDIKLWKKSEYWASYKEFICIGAGDDEDFAIAKYFTLINMGIFKEKLKISVATTIDKNKSRKHIVLLYYHRENSDPVVLDNLRQKLIPLSKRIDLKIQVSLPHDRILNTLKR